MSHYKGETYLPSRKVVIEGTAFHSSYEYCSCFRRAKLAVIHYI